MFPKTNLKCPPCKAIKPFYEDLAKTYDLQGIKFAKIDIDDNGDAAAAAGIRAVPTFIFRGEGETGVKEEFSGADRNQLEDKVKNLL